MRNRTAGLVAILAVAFSPAIAQEDMTEQIQEDEQPGSEIEMDIGGGEVDVRRKSGAPVFAPGKVPREIEIGGENPEPPIDDPDTPLDGADPIDEELPGEGPEDLSGPVGEDD